MYDAQAAHSVHWGKDEMVFFFSKNVKTKNQSVSQSDIRVQIN